MADSKPAKNRIIKKPETVRERASKSSDDKPKRRILRGTASRVGRPLHVLAPAAKPFRVKPVRKVGKVLGFVLWPPFFRGAFQELRQVTWPGRKETWRLTGAVFVFALVFGALIAITDYGLDKLFRKVILK